MLLYSKASYSVGKCWGKINKSEEKMWEVRCSIPGVRKRDKCLEVLVYHKWVNRRSERLIVKEGVSTQGKRLGV